MIPENSGADMGETKEPIRLPTVVGMTGAGLAGAHYQSATDAIATLWLVAQDGQMILLPLSDTGLSALHRTISQIVQGFDDPNMPGPFAPPTRQ